MQVLAIAVGVALGYAVHLINTSALSEFSSAVRAVTGQADASITGTREGFDEQVFARVVAHPAVELASPVLELEVAGARDCRERARRCFRSSGSTSSARRCCRRPWCRRPADNGSRFAVLDDGVFLSPAALARFKVAVGGELRVLAGTRQVVLPVVGTLPGARAGQVVGVMDLGFAQWRLDRLGRLTRIDLKLAPGIDRRVAVPRPAAAPGRGDGKRRRARPRACRTCRVPIAST